MISSSAWGDYLLLLPQENALIRDKVLLIRNMALFTQKQ